MKKPVIVVLVVFVVACLGYVIFGMSGEPKGDGSDVGADGKAVAGATDDGAAGSKKAPVNKKDDDSPEDPDEAPDKDLKLPGQLPKLDLPDMAETAVPTKPHGKVQIEGELDEVTAEMAIRTLFPKIRGCYAELRGRAPQAKGRMLMRIRVRSGEAGKAGTGELYLKETQFTDPKYLTCVRTAIDEAKFNVDKAGINGTAEFPMFLEPEDVTKHEQAVGSAATGK